MRVIIVGGGDAPTKKLVLSYINSNTKIIAADSGANYLIEYDIQPDYVVGDFDSIDKEIIRDLKNGEVVQYPVDKDFTDTELAYNKALDIGAKEIVFLGCTGKRQDHFFANMCVLYKALVNNIQAYMIDEYNKIFLVNKKVSLRGKKGDVFSVFSYFEDVEQLTISGAKYPLKEFNLTMKNNLTVSNEFLDEEVHIDFKNGILAVVISK